MGNPTEGVKLPVAAEKADEIAEKHEKLTERQKQFATTLVSEGLSVTKAAQAIGADRAWAFRALRKQHVSDYMEELRQVSMGALRSRATAVAHQLLSEGSKRQQLELVQTLLSGETQREERPQQAVQVNINLGE